jgi:hypothetical protein
MLMGRCQPTLDLAVADGVVGRGQLDEGDQAGLHGRVVAGQPMLVADGKIADA